RRNKAFGPIPVSDRLLQRNRAGRLRAPKFGIQSVHLQHQTHDPVQARHPRNCPVLGGQPIRRDRQPAGQTQLGRASAVGWSEEFLREVAAQGSWKMAGGLPLSGAKVQRGLITVGREENGGAPLLALFEKWAAGQPTPKWVRFTRTVAQVSAKHPQAGCRTPRGFRDVGGHVSSPMNRRNPTPTY